VRGLKLDSMIAAFVLDSSRESYGIDRLAAEAFRIKKIATVDLIGTGRRQISMKQVDLDRVTRYASEDADICLRLCRAFREQFTHQPQLTSLLDDLETPLVEVLTEMEFAGVCVDPAVLREHSAVLGEKVEQLRESMIKLAGCSFNPDSPRQLADVLFGRMNLPVLKRNKTGPSTDVEVLEKLPLDHELPRVAL
jgi:DNA polymerase-1